MGIDSISDAFVWGNASYYNLDIGGSVEYAGRKITLLSIKADHCVIDIDGESRDIIVARRSLPEVINGIRVFAADNINIKKLTSDNKNHGLLKKDALLCLSDLAKPLLDPGRFCFPVSRKDGFKWTMEESSHMFAYLSLATFLGPDYYRSHEGIDINLHDARGTELHPLTAIESGTVMRVWFKSTRETCVLIKSDSNPDIYYIYQHLNTDRVYVKEGQHVQCGDEIACIWGDERWGHLHFSVVYNDTVPEYQKRYSSLVNSFPQLYELWFGDLVLHRKTWPAGYFTFGRPYWDVENKRREHTYDELTGYGWVLGDWCAAGAVEYSQLAENDFPKNVRLRKTIHEGHAAQARNPADYFDFEIAVPDDTYHVRIRLGDSTDESWQRIEVENVELGIFDLKKCEFIWTPAITVPVNDGRLTLRFHLKDEKAIAALDTIEFIRV